MKKNIFTYIYLVLTLLLVGIFYYFNTHKYVKQKINVTGTTIINNFVTKKINQDALSNDLVYQNDTNANAINSTFNNKADVAFISRDLKGSEKNILNRRNISNKLFATDALAFIVSDNVKLKDINNNILKKILTTKNLRWSELDKKFPSNIIKKAMPSTELGYFDNKISSLEKDKEFKKDVTNTNFNYNNIKDIIQKVNENDDYIGVVPLSSIYSLDSVNKLSYNNVDLNEKTLLKRKYSLTFPINILWNKSKKSQHFVDTIYKENIIKKLYSPNQNYVFIPNI